MNDDIIVSELRLFYQVVTKDPYTVEDISAVYEAVYIIEMFLIIVDAEETFSINDEYIHKMLEIAFPGCRCNKDSAYWLIAPRYKKASIEHMNHLRESKTRIRQMYIDIALDAL